jgi:hypothetical protein
VQGRISAPLSVDSSVRNVIVKLGRRADSALTVKGPFGGTGDCLPWGRKRTGGFLSSGRASGGIKVSAKPPFDGQGKVEGQSAPMVVVHKESGAPEGRGCPMGPFKIVRVGRPAALFRHSRQPR